MPEAVSVLLEGTGWAFDEVDSVTQVRPYEPGEPTWDIGTVDAHLHNHGWACWIEPGETTIRLGGPADA